MWRGSCEVVDLCCHATLAMRCTVAGALQRISIRVRPSLMTGTQCIVRQAGPVTVLATFFMGFSFVDLRRSDTELGVVHLMFISKYSTDEQEVNTATPGPSQPNTGSVAQARQRRH